MAGGRSGLTPGAEVTTIRRVSNQGSRFRPISDGIALIGTASRGTGRAVPKADLNRIIWEKVS
jgi:hypothetical protein